MNAPTLERRLTRSRDERMIAGVCGGIARYFGLDPIVVRVALVVASIIGGSGVLAYIVAWVVMPEGDDEEDEIPGRRRPRSHSAPRGGAAGCVLLAMGLILFLPMMLDGWPWHGGGTDLLPAVALLGIGAWLLMRGRGDDDVVPGEPSWIPSSWSPPRAPERGDTTSFSRVATTRHDPATDDTTITAITTELDPTIDDTSVFEPVVPWTSYFDQPVATPAASLGHDDDLDDDELDDELDRAPDWRGRRRGRGRWVSRLVLAALLVYAGIVWAITGSGAGTLEPGTVIAIALVIVAAGCVLASVFGRRSGLLSLGVLLAGALAAVTVVDVPIEGGAGDRTYRPDDEAALLAGSPYRLAAGDMTLDLSEIDLPPGTYEIEASVAAGELHVTIPDDVEVVLDAHVQLGDLRNDFGNDQDGWDIDVHERVGPAAAERDLVLELDVGAGELVISRA